MTHETPTETKNLDQYGETPIPWDRTFELLIAAPDQLGTSFFLNTIRPNGTPHSASFGALWVDGGFLMMSGPGTRKSKNLDANPACTVTVGLKGIDLVLEGSAQRVTDKEFLEKAAKSYREHGWPAEVDGEGFTAPYTAPSGGPPPWNLYRFTFHTAFGVGEGGATRWRFAH